MVLLSITRDILNDPITDVVITDGVISTADFYVDSESGSDSNDGLTPITAKRTLSATSALLSGDDQTIGVARGSIFVGEQFDVSGINNTRITTYLPPSGATEPPEFYGRVVKSSWTKTAGRTNIYEAVVDTTTWTGGPNYSEAFITAFQSTGAASEVSRTDRPMLEQDGADLDARLTALDSTQGGFVGDKTGSPAKVYIHTHDSSSPTTNGRAYSVSQVHTFVAPENGLHSISGVYADGYAQDDGLRAHHMSDCEATNHVNHNFYHDCDGNGLSTISNLISSNARARPGFTEDARTAGPFIWYQGTAGTYNATVTGCQSIQDPTLEAELRNDDVGGFGCHAGTGITLDSYTLNNCRASNGKTSVSLGDVITSNINDSNFTDMRYGISGGTGNVTINIRRSFLNGKTLNPLRSMERVIDNIIAGCTVTLEGNVILPTKASGGSLNINSGATIIVRNNTIDGEYQQQNIAMLGIQSSGANVTFERNIVTNLQWPIYLYAGVPGSVISAINDNVYFNMGGGLHLDPTDYTNITDWRNAIDPGGTNGHETNSVISDPQWDNDPATWTQISDATASAPIVSTLNAGAHNFVG